MIDLGIKSDFFAYSHFADNCKQARCSLLSRLNYFQVVLVQIHTNFPQNFQ